MPLTGDFGKLRLLLEKMEAASDGTMLAEINENLGLSLLDQVHQCFDESHDPDGNAYPPLEIRVGVPLRDTGRLRESIQVTSTKSEVKIGTNCEYAEAQQLGTPPQKSNGKPLRMGNSGGYAMSTRGSPARPFFPTGGLPSSWEREMNEVAELILEQNFKGVG